MQFEITVDVYFHTMFFYLGESERDNYAEAIGLDKNDTDTMEYFKSASGFTSGNTAWIMESDDINIVVHEVSHLVDGMLEDHGLPADDTEVRAYLMGYIVSEYYGKIMEARRADSSAQNTGAQVTGAQVVTIDELEERFK